MAKITRTGTYTWESADGVVKVFWNKGLHQQGAVGYTVSVNGSKSVFYTQKEALAYARGFIK